jgi:hypothetical protein
MLAKGRTIPDVVHELCGDCSRGRAWQRRLLSMLGSIPTAKSRRKVLEHFLRLFSGARRHGRMFRVADAWGYIGRQHRERVDPETGEVRIGPRGRPSCHVPGGEAGGQAARDRRSPRQLQNYRRHLREHEIMGSQRTPWDATDAVRPSTEGACFAYSQHWLVGAPSPRMLSKLDGTVSEAAYLEHVDAEERAEREYLGIVLAGEDVELARLRRRREIALGRQIPADDVPY